MTSTQLELYHRASVYQLRRALDQLKAPLVPLLSEALRSRSSEWEAIDIRIRDLQLFRCTSDGTAAPRFRWLTYLVNEMTALQFESWREYFDSERGKRVENALQYLVNDSPQGLSAIKILRSVLATARRTPTERDLRELHHSLLLIFTSIQTSGFLLGSLAKQVEGLNGESSGILIQIEGEGAVLSKHELPGFWSSVAVGSSAPPDDKSLEHFGERHEQPGIDVHFRPGIEATADQRRLLGEFFQEVLYPYFSYSESPAQQNAENLTVRGQREQRIFGFIVFPLHLAYRNRDGTSAGGVGQWQGAVVAQLVSDEQVPNDLRRFACISPLGFETLRSIPVGKVLQSLAEGLVESDAVTVIQSDTLPPDAVSAFVDGFAYATGWSVTHQPGVAAPSSPVERDPTNGSVLRVNLDWDWPTPGESKPTVIRLEIPGLDLNPGLHRTAGEMDSHRDELDLALGAEVFHTCNKIYHSIFTLWHAQRSIKQAKSPLRELKDGMRGWFSSDAAVVPHNYHVARERKEPYVKLTRELFPFVVDSWWSDDASFQRLHESLKSLCSAFWPETRSGQWVNVGALYLLVLLAVSNRFGIDSARELMSIDFPAAFEPLDIVYENNDALTAETFVTKVYTLLLQVIERRGGNQTPGKIAIRGLTTNNRSVVAQLDWEPSDVANFVHRYKKLVKQTLDQQAEAPVTSIAFSLVLAEQLHRALALGNPGFIGYDGVIGLFRDGNSFYLKIG